MPGAAQSHNFWTPMLSLNDNNAEINLPALPNRKVIVEQSSDLINWFHWDAIGNDGLSRNPASANHTLSAPAKEFHEFFRLQIEER